MLPDVVLQCIDQTNLDEKHSQISNMDRIYSGASLVIIDAAGDDPSYGLPGVSTRGRRPQHIIKAGSCTLVEIFLDPKPSLMDSKWRSRAWTFQEGYLARRRLLFTKQQVVYICNNGFCVESSTSTILHEKANPGLSTVMFFFSRRINNPNLVSQPGNQRLHQAEYVLKEYMTRELSYPGDALNACAGIFNFWKTSRLYPIDALLWGQTYEPIKGINLAWAHTAPGLRRSEFPSWSWLGWKGPVEFSHSLDSELASIEIGYDRHGPFVPAEDCFNTLRASPLDLRNAPRTLRITSICPRITLTRGSNQLIDSAYVFESPTQSHKFGVCTDSNILPETDLGDWIALLIKTRGWSRRYTIHKHESWPPSYVTDYEFLLLRPAAIKGIHERVGKMRSNWRHEIRVEEETLPFWERRTVLIE
jgi:hypothetical protein